MTGQWLRSRLAGGILRGRWKGEQREEGRSWPSLPTAAVTVTTNVVAKAACFLQQGVGGSGVQKVWLSAA